MKRIESSDSINEVMERIVGRGIEVEPLASLRLIEPEWLKKGRWVVDCVVPSISEAA